jgi:hypothetical protein
MASPLSRVGSALFLAVFVAAGMAACGSNGSSAHTGSGASMSSSGGGHGGSGAGASGSTGSGISLAMGSGGAGTGGNTQSLDVTPTTLQTLAVTAGQTMPTVTFNATLDGNPIAVAWGVDLGNVGTITAGSASAGVFAPSGTAGGLVTITAGLNGQTVQRQVLVKLSALQSGPTAGEQGQVPAMASQLTAGVGGVGGEGLGPAVTDMPTLTALGSPTSNGQAQGLGFLYPYDKTVWPRGLLAPLLMWSWSTGDADAIQIGLSTANGSFTWTGTFGKPAILGATGKFIRSPIPQDVWDMATNSAGGTANPLTVTLTVAKGGMAYGPLTETWTIAPARLSGTIYYQSYGTQLAKNYTGAVGGNGQFGGAVLSIHVGDTAPKIAAGTSAMSPTGCRVCHSVASGGSRLAVVDGNDESLSSAYDLAPTGNTEHVMTHLAQYPAMFPDGSLALTPAGSLLPLPTDTTPIPTTGLTSVVTNLGQPAFSPDGTMIAFNPLGGTLKLNQALYAMTFDKAASAFGAATLIADDTGQPAATRPGWPAFFPDSKSVVYHHQTQASICGSDPYPSLATRSGTRAEIYWTNLSGPASVTPLDQLNGKGYLPKLPAPAPLVCSDDCGNSVASGAPTALSNDDHSDDVNVNYEPTVNPIASGGYAWVVFTSRRMYGNEATVGSFCSDPRGVDLINNITPKKLWVAAIDLSQAPGVDSSHPAFYLPAQELLAGNARGFWTLDPCAADGTSCMTGDQCCNGYCEPSGSGGALVCSTKPPDTMCSMTGDKCTTGADCCTATDKCINGFCAQASPG